MVLPDAGKRRVITWQVLSFKPLVNGRYRLSLNCVCQTLKKN